MFTDTKNLTNANHLMDNGGKNKSKGKLHKVWKPLFRLLSLKSNNKSSNAISHPNNVNLNNSSSLREICELSTTMLEEYASSIRKAESEYSKVDISSSTISTTISTSQTEDISPKDVTVISSASIDKSSTSTSCCYANCIYGRNCQHNHTAEEDAYLSTQLTIIEEPSTDELEVPIQFVRTESGTFFWTPAQDRIDDDLLNAWLCHSFRQFPLQTTLC